MQAQGGKLLKVTTVWKWHWGPALFALNPLLILPQCRVPCVLVCVCVYVCVRERDRNGKMKRTIKCLYCSTNSPSERGIWELESGTLSN